MKTDNIVPLASSAAMAAERGQIDMDAQIPMSRIAAAPGIATRLGLAVDDLCPLRRQVHVNGRVITRYQQLY